MISIILPSFRVGGFDVLFASLRESSYQDFEVIIVDELRPYRRHATEQVGAGGVWHVAPGNPPGSPRWGWYMKSLNRGLDYCRNGAPDDVLLFVSDYTAFGKDTLAEHAKFHASRGPKDVALGPIEYTALPPLHPDFPRKYGWSAIGHDPANYSDATYAPWLDFKRRHELYEEWREAYERDLDSGVLDPFMASTFAEPFKSADGLKVYETQTRQPPSQFLNLKNDSMRRDLLQGFRFDERADGTHGHQDSITHRQLAKLGATFAPGGGACKILDPHPIALIRRKGLNDEANLRLAEEAQ